VKPAQKVQALELLLHACDEAGKVALALTDKHVCSDAAAPASAASKARILPQKRKLYSVFIFVQVAAHCSVLSRLQDLHILLEGGSIASSSSSKRAPADSDSRPPLHPADAGRGLSPAAAPSAAAAAIPSLRLLAAALKQPLQSTRLTYSDFSRQCSLILKDMAAPAPPVTSAPSISALRNELRCSLGLDRAAAGDAAAAAEVENAVKEGSDSIVAAVTAIGDAAAAFPWCALLPPPAAPLLSSSLLSNPLISNPLLSIPLCRQVHLSARAAGRQGQVGRGRRRSRRRRSAQEDRAVR
jgi:hypothetical protein